MDVAGKVVIITGASMGIGAAAARVFAEAGAKIVLAARSASKLEEVAKSLPAHAEPLVVPTDMTDSAQVRALVDAAHERFGQIDLLINNAGQALVSAVAEISPERYRQIIELNVMGPLHAMQAVIPKMQAQGGGVIMNISSGVSKMAIPMIGAYASTKYALNGLTLTARNELAGQNIRVLLFHPGQTATEFGHNAMIDGKPSFQAPEVDQIDSAEDVARKMLEAATSEAAEMAMPARH
ncbi:SDR family NAD(P)-dependent oxidoreductase [Chloroflexia bacterium SDU3-3]|nr:SDR family NAD(P)-dependent oxidoreductase [Chloroflexia bacterium SDU3-3]